MFFRLLTLLLLELAIAETPLGTGLAFAEEQTRPVQRSRELLPGDLPARHALPENPSTEVAGGEFQVTASYADNGFDQPDLDVSGSGAAAEEQGSVEVARVRPRSVPAPAHPGSARDPPPAA